MNDFKTAGIAAVVAAFVALIVAIGGRLISPPPQFITVQVEQLLAEHIQAQAKQEATAEQRLQAAEAFARRLDSALGEAAQRHGAIILASGAVVRGAVDVTPEMRAALSLNSPEPPP
ncbi:TrbI F-type domain-containing protein [Solimonas sp. SE-A11]|uniref:TrbI F-type domain-containing protein n=1 Tax=Solimonas sp. SE-A11 TaxID=3054954 RepID=UPI00259C7E2D|nr:TrbI F-type domain-containing protein [Solimonas sp. SE-A11]MDM4770899.1 TrbI F-type domain-containing protein [Solimonas sp. SE-A11]